MNKALLITIGFFLVTNLYGQKHAIGINGGIIASNIITDIIAYESSTYKIGEFANINYERYITEKIAIEVGLQYENKGFNDYFIWLDDKGNEIRKEKYKTHYKYLSLPISVKYVIGNQLKGFGRLGVAPAYFLKSKIEYPNVISPLPIIPVENRANRWDICPFVGIGVAYELSQRFEVNVNGIINLGLRSMTNYQYWEKYKARNYYYGINLGMKYYLQNE